MKPTAVPSALKNSLNTTPTTSKNTKESKGKAVTTSSTSINNPNLISKLGKDGKLTIAEQKHHFDNKLCMFYSLTGHMAKNCLKSTSWTSKGCRVMTTPEAELEVSLEGKKSITTSLTPHD